MVFRRQAGSETSRFGDECVVLDESGRTLRGLNAAGARVWELLDGRRSAGEIARSISREFAVPVEAALADVGTFLLVLEDRALVHREGGAGAGPGPKGGAR
ncbi:MAG: PqqD family protein [Myxococcales bacterium]|nr:PqqD family protein [Myxococcales bacterium]